MLSGVWMALIRDDDDGLDGHSTWLVAYSNWR
jgi:hypothetical protein